MPVPGTIEEGPLSYERTSSIKVGSSKDPYKPVPPSAPPIPEDFSELSGGEEAPIQL
jgi:hypothetical protein